MGASMLNACIQANINSWRRAPSGRFLRRCLSASEWTNTQDTQVKNGVKLRTAYWGWRVAMNVELRILPAAIDLPWLQVCPIPRRVRMCYNALCSGGCKDKTVIKTMIFIFRIQYFKCVSPSPSPSMRCALCEGMLSSFYNTKHSTQCRNMQK